MSDSTGSIDFSEITTHTAFEDFALELLERMGFEIEIGPGEGNDRGKDFIVSQLLSGRFSKTKVKYLVSCKHQRAAVGTKDEFDVSGRVAKHGCDAFIGVYSSHLSQATVDDFDGYKKNWRGGPLFDIVVLDGAKIRKELIENPAGPALVRRWFPRAHRAYLHTMTESYVYRLRPIFRCHVCKDDVLQKLDGAIVYQLSYGSSSDPYTPSEWESGRDYLHDIRPYCALHAPVSGSFGREQLVLPLDRLIDPSQYSKLVQRDIGRSYFKPPYFANDTVFRKWIHFTQGLFYFVARGKPVPLEDKHVFFPDRHEL
jgi:hypothetical protein